MIKVNEVYRVGTTTYVPVIDGLVFAITDSGGKSIVKEIPEYADISLASEDNKGKTPTGVRTNIETAAFIAGAIKNMKKSM